MDNQLKDRIIAEAKRVEEDSTYSAKRHFEAARIWNTAHLSLGLPAAILSAIAGISAFNEHNVAAGILAIIVTALAAVITFLNPSEKAKVHLDAGNQYNSLRNRARIFSSITCSDPNADAELQAKLIELTQKRDELNETSQITSRSAFEKARQGIEEGEAQYRVDQEKTNTPQLRQ